MNSKRKAEKILKAYGKALYQSRVEFADSFSKENISRFHRISCRHLMQRFLVIVLVLVIAFSLLVIGGNALGIKFLNLSFLEKEDHTEVTAEAGSTDDTQESGQDFYQHGYIPEGFTLVNTDEFAGIETTYSYVNENDDFFNIAQCKSDRYTASINNEDCEIREDTIEDMEARIYTYHDPKSVLAVIRKGDIYIQISGLITEEEVRKIVQGLS